MKKFTLYLILFYSLVFFKLASSFGDPQTHKINTRVTMNAAPSKRPTQKAPKPSTTQNNVDPTKSNPKHTDATSERVQTQPPGQESLKTEDPADLANIYRGLLGGISRKNSTGPQLTPREQKEIGKKIKQKKNRG